MKWFQDGATPADNARQLVDNDRWQTLGNHYHYSYELKYTYMEEDNIRSWDEHL